MARPALSASRALKVLNLLAAHPGESYKLSELSQELGINSGSLHAILSVLTSEGYVVRDDRRKTYHLGASLVAVGQAALDELPVVRRAKEEAKALAEGLGMEVIASVHIGRELLVIASEGRPERMAYRPRVAQRLPYVPPIGIVGAAFMPPDEREAWLDAIGPGATEEQKRGYREAVEAARRSGYEIGLETPTRDKIGLAMFDVQADPLSKEATARLVELIAQLGREEHHLVHPEPGRLYEVNHMTAPIFGAKGELVAGLALLGFDSPLDAPAIDRYLKRLMASAARVTRETGGRPPST
jgi:DNA-binding IclR family transcriptional regulator